MNGIGKGIAIAGIWIGVGIVSISAGEIIGLVAMFAMVATVAGLIVW